MFLLLLFAAIARGYDNDSRGPDGVGLHEGGPHRTINELALDSVFANMRSPGMGELTEDPDSLLFGPIIIAPGLEIVESGKANQPVRWWVIEGGYTADEPELYNSFRHFYDPTNPDTPYLTDDLEKLNYAYRALLWTTPAIVAAPVLGTNFNPQVNARDWALTGEAKNGLGANEYSLAKGVEYYHLAFTAPSYEKQDEYLAKAWRSLGETMHLLADMTCVPHVRNDSHPGRALYVTGNTDPNVGMLKNDPYELYCTESMIRQYKDYPVDPVIKAQIDGAPTPAELFYRVALYTNKNFFSSDTISGHYLSTAGNPDGELIEVTPANGQQPYPSPKLQNMRFDEDTGYFVNPDNNVRMCHISWLSAVGWGDISGMAVTLPCVEDQAKVLVPVAIYANARLAKMFLPRFVISDEKYEKEVTTLYNTYNVNFTFRHIPGGLHPDPITINSFLTLVVYVNGKRRGVVIAKATNDDRTSFSFTPDGAFEEQLNNGDRFTFAVEFGGMLYPSNASFTFIKRENTDGGYCVTGDTPVRLADGTHHPIAKICAGDQIIAYDEASGAGATATVEQVLIHREGPFLLSRLTLATGNSISVTANHPILTREAGWLPVDQLRPGMTVLVWDAARGELAETTVAAIVRDVSESDTVYNLKTTQGNYLADDLVVHNKCLARGTPIDTPDGPRLVETLRVGDLVLGWVAGRRIPVPITHVYMKTTALPSLPGISLAPGVVVTVNHRVWRDGAFHPAGDSAADRMPIFGPVYDLQTTAGNYFAAEMLMTANED